MIRRVRWWDLASSVGRRADWTCGVRMVRLASGRFVVEDVNRGRWNPADRDELILATARRDGHVIAIGFEEDPGQAGKSQSAALARLLAGYAVHFVRPTGDKATRATPCASQWGQGNILVLKRPWTRDFLAELASFPRGRHDDQVDAFAGAFNFLARSHRGSADPVGVGRRPGVRPLIGAR